MVQKYLFVASSWPGRPPEFTNFYLESLMAGVFFLRGATLHVIVINPFSTVH